MYFMTFKHKSDGAITFIVQPPHLVITLVQEKCVTPTTHNYTHWNAFVAFQFWGQVSPVCMKSLTKAIVFWSNVPRGRCLNKLISFIHATFVSCEFV